MSSLGENAYVGNLIVEKSVVNAGTQTCKSLAVNGDITCTGGGTQTFQTTQAESLFLTTGQLDINGLATTNPGLAGRVWNDGGTLKIV